MRRAALCYIYSNIAIYSSACVKRKNARGGMMSRSVTYRQRRRFRQVSTWPRAKSAERFPTTSPAATALDPALGLDNGARWLIGGKPAAEKEGRYAMAYTEACPSWGARRSESART